MLEELIAPSLGVLNRHAVGGLVGEAPPVVIFTIDRSDDAGVKRKASVCAALFRHDPQTRHVDFLVIVIQEVITHRHAVESLLAICLDFGATCFV